MENNLAAHAADYKENAHQAYSAHELAAWVLLFTKRSEHRSDAAKKAKDLYDAGNYRSMLVERVGETRAAEMIQPDWNIIVLDRKEI